MRRRISAVLAVAVLFASGLVAASAASLGSLSSGIFAAAGGVTHASASRSVSDLVLTTSGSPATVTGLTVTVTGADLAQLGGQSMTVVLFDSSGVQAYTATAALATGGNLTVGAGSATVTLPVAGAPLASSFASWSVFIGGVQALGPVSDPTLRVVTLGKGTLTVPTTPLTWQELLVSTTAPFSAITAVTVAVSSTSSVCIDISMTGTKSNPELWNLLVDYSQAPFWGAMPTVDDHVGAVAVSGSVMTLTGTSDGTRNYHEFANNKELTIRTVLTVRICRENPPLPAAPEAYTVSAQTQGTWTSELACVRKTVTGNGTYPFYFGWSVPLDLTAAYAKLREADPTAPRAFVSQPNTVTPAFSATTTSYTVTNARDTAIAGTGSYVVELCASRY